jgi:hypothetical protein
MLWFFPPSKKSTPSEYAVLVWFVCAVFIIVGIVALVVGLRAPDGKHDLAVALESRGAWCLGIGCAIAAGYWLYRRLVDY